MIDMGAILGGRATVGDDCHIGARRRAGRCGGARIRHPGGGGGPRAHRRQRVVLEGVRIGAGAVVAAGAVVRRTCPQAPWWPVRPARIIKMKDEKTAGKTTLVDALRSL